MGLLPTTYLLLSEQSVIGQDAALKYRLVSDYSARPQMCDHFSHVAADAQKAIKNKVLVRINDAYFPM